MNEARQVDADILPASVDAGVAKLGIRQVTGLNEATTLTRATVRGHTAVTDEPYTSDQGPTPLETVLIGLVGCEGVIIRRVADAMEFAYSRVEISCDGEVDGRGSRGVPGVRPYFNWIELKIRITSSEPASRLLTLQKNVEFRCPVMNLMRDAGVDVRAKWILTPEGKA